MDDIVLELFCIYDENNEFASGSNGPRLLWTDHDVDYKDIHKLRVLRNKYKKGLHITTNESEIRSIFDSFNVIVLRKYQNESKLILGCGNNPLSFGATFLRNDWDQTYKSDNDYIKKCQWDNHMHNNEYTINPDVGMNPSMVGEFGINDFTFLGKQIFEEIIFEEFIIESYLEDNVYTSSNINTITMLIYLLRENGKVILNGKSIFFKKNNALVSINDNTKLDCDSPEIYHQFYLTWI